MLRAIAKHNPLLAIACFLVGLYGLSDIEEDIPRRVEGDRRSVVA
ncbi:hypothetical protein [Nostoc sp. WHI]|nr:hypothetical protein [Nostoc sp. WHI]